MARKKIKPDEAINEILVADTDSESGSEASDFEDYFEEEEEEEDQQQQPPPAEGNFCDNSNLPVKPHIVERYNWHMGYINNFDCMANSYSMS